MTSPGITNSDGDDGGNEVRIVLLGKTGVGKSATGNTILRREAFKSKVAPCSETRECQKEMTEFNRRRITVIDTPGLFDTGVDNVETRKEIVKCVSMAAPGPHVFLLVIQLGRFTQEEIDAVKMIQDMFGDKSRMYTMVLFTRGDDLRGKRIQEFIEDDENLQYLIHQCGKRYHVFNNKDTKDQTQVSELLDKIDCMVAVNGGSFYTNETFQQVEKNIREEQERIMKEKEEEIKRREEELKAKYEDEKELMKKEKEREKQEMQNELRKSEEEFKKREEEIKKETDENLRKELQRKLEEKQKLHEEENKIEEKALGEQQLNFIKYLEEKHKKEKQKLREKNQRETREQAEREYLIKLEREVDNALQEYNRENTEAFHDEQVQPSCDYSFYTNEMLQQMVTNIRERQERIIKEKEEETMRREEELTAKYEAEIEEMKKKNERERQEMQNELRKIEDKLINKEKEIKEEKDEKLQKELQRKLEEQKKLYEEEKENRKKNMEEKHQESILLGTRELTKEEALQKCLLEIGDSLDGYLELQSLLEQVHGCRHYRDFIGAAAGRVVGSFQNIVYWIIGSRSQR
ncbi:golgin subfamily A member 6-like protein 22 [Sinocyclocheilus rhinocerous]|uniref:golgin subfamily A member 6-like protein 22 n=1 Tax=Sinocyclocheilus rhinocerous TaxID=307959 RepID=UPI0007B85EA6|nr:PREDICTED: golgin subfamily A member 6-like protein 22 [Sinocyclocheilus rhinocerous]